jgi:mRNA-degrading endonuclease RelE of RelBE toxin-antitoxin system
MQYEIEFDKRFFKALKKITVAERNKIIKTTEKIASEPRPHNAKN